MLIIGERVESLSAAKRERIYNNISNLIGELIMDEKIFHYILKVNSVKGNSFVLCRIFKKYGVTFAEFKEFVSNFPRIDFKSIPNTRQFTFMEDLLVFSRANDLVATENYEEWIMHKMKEVYGNDAELKIERFN